MSFFVNHGRVLSIFSKFSSIFSLESGNRSSRGSSRAPNSPSGRESPKIVLGVDAVVAVLIIVASIFALLGANGIRGTVSEAKTEMQQSEYSDPLAIDLYNSVGNIIWFATTLGIAGIVYGIKRLIDDLMPPQ